MFKKLLVLLFVLLGSESWAACNGFNRPTDAKKHETITVSTVAIGFTVATYTDANNIVAKYALCTIETNPIRVWPDAVLSGNPTAAVGQSYVAATSLETCGQQQIINTKMIRAGAADATLSCVYYWDN